MYIRIQVPLDKSCLNQSLFLKSIHNVTLPTAPLRHSPLASKLHLSGFVPIVLLCLRYTYDLVWSDGSILLVEPYEIQRHIFVKDTEASCPISETVYLAIDNPILHRISISPSLPGIIATLGRLSPHDGPIHACCHCGSIKFTVPRPSSNCTMPIPTESTVHKRQRKQRHLFAAFAV